MKTREELAAEARKIVDKYNRDGWNDVPTWEFQSVMSEMFRAMEDLLEATEAK